MGSRVRGNDREEHFAKSHFSTSPSGGFLCRMLAQPFPMGGAPLPRDKSWATHRLDWCFRPHDADSIFPIFSFVKNQPVDGSSRGRRYPAFRRVRPRHSMHGSCAQSESWSQLTWETRASGSLTFAPMIKSHNINASSPKKAGKAML